MLRTTVVILTMTLMGSAAAQVEAQGRGSARGRQDRQTAARAQGVPPGHMPPANLCRVWYDNRPNGRQPAATSCRQAEMIAARDGNARVIYGENLFSYGRYPGTWDRDRNDRARDDRAVSRIPGRNRDPRAGTDRSGNRLRYTPAFQNGYRDGLEKGREDADDNDRYDPTRHSWYRSATRGHKSEYGPRVDYQPRYREGFAEGYAEASRSFSRR